MNERSNNKSVFFILLILVLRKDFKNIILF